MQLSGRFEVLAVINYVMTAASIGASRGGGYARYLESKTVEPERGDYYLTPDGEMTQAPGRWLADAETLDRQGIVAGESVDGVDFIALMEGRHPGTGGWLRPEGAGGGRGGGIDVTFSAPKSVSTVWALGDPWQREQAITEEGGSAVYYGTPQVHCRHTTPSHFGCSFFNVTRHLGRRVTVTYSHRHYYVGEPRYEASREY